MLDPITTTDKSQKIKDTDMANQIKNSSSEINASHTIEVQKAQLVTNQLLEKLTSKANYSSEVMEFLQGIWRQVLCNTYLTQGESSSHWKNLKKISSTLVWSLLVKNRVEEKRVMIRTLPSLLRALSRCMDLVHLDTGQKEAVFKMLVIEHAKIIKKSGMNITISTDNTSASSDKDMTGAQSSHDGGNTRTCEEPIDFIFDEETTGEIRIVDFSTINNQDSGDVSEGKNSSNGIIKNMDDFSTSVTQGDIKFDDEDLIGLVMQQISSVDNIPSESNEYIERTQSLKIGTWVDFDTSGTINKVGELFWKSNMTGKCVFMNSEGEKITTMNVDDIYSELGAGRAEIVEPKI